MKIILLALATIVFAGTPGALIAQAKKDVNEEKKDDKKDNKTEKKDGKDDKKEEKKDAKDEKNDEKKDGKDEKKDEKPDLKVMLIGKWEAVRADLGTVPVGATLEFAADGKMKATVKGTDKSLDGTYTIEGDTFSYKLGAGKDEVSHKIKVKRITDTEMDAAGDTDEKAASFKKVK